MTESNNNLESNLESTEGGPEAASKSLKRGVEARRAV